MYASYKFGARKRKLMWGYPKKHLNSFHFPIAIIVVHLLRHVISVITFQKP